MDSSQKIAGFLVVLFPPEIAGKLPLYHGNNIVGRTSAKASLVLAEPSISQKHANIILSTTKTTLIDIGSKNGTKINGVDNLIEKNQPVDVDESMIIHFADVKCQLELLEPEQPTKDRPPVERVNQKDKKRAEIMTMFDDESRPKDFTKIEPPRKEAIQPPPPKDEFKKLHFNDFDIDEDVEEKGKKDVKNQGKKIELKKGKSKSLESSQDFSNLLKAKNNDNGEASKAEKVTNGAKKAQIQKNQKKKDDKQAELSRETLISKSNAEEEKSLATKSKPLPAKKEQKKKSPVRSPAKGTKINNSLGIPAKKKESPTKRTEKSKKEQSLLLPEENKIRKSKRLSNQREEKEEQRTEVETKLVAPASTGLKKGKKSLHGKEEASKPKSRLTEVSKDHSPAQKSQNIKIKITKPSETGHQNRFIKPKQENALDTIPQSDNSHSTTKKKTNRKRRMTSSLSRNNDHSNHRMIPPRSDKVGKRILISGTFLPLKRKFFKVIQDYKETFDFLIMKTYTRTFKALLAILRGIPIVSSEWVRDSENIGSILKVESYYFEDNQNIYESIDKGSKGDKIFEGFYFYLASQEYHMEKEQIELLIEAGGGSVIAKSNKDSLKSKKDIIITLVCNETAHNKPQFQADLTHAKKLLNPNKIYNIQLILDSCEHQEFDLTKHRVVTASK